MHALRLCRLGQVLERLVRPEDDAVQFLDLLEDLDFLFACFHASYFRTASGVNQLKPWSRMVTSPSG